LIFLIVMFAFLRSWLLYLALRFLLTVRFEIEIFHHWIAEMPIWCSGRIHSVALLMSYRLWQVVQSFLFVVYGSLTEADSSASQYVWMPPVSFYPLGYS